MALIYLERFDKADEDLFELEDLIGGSKELEDLESLFEQKKKDKKWKEDELYRKMFRKYVEGNILFNFSSGQKRTYKFKK